MNHILTKSYFPSSNRWTPVLRDGHPTAVIGCPFCGKRSCLQPLVSGKLSAEDENWISHQDPQNQSHIANSIRPSDTGFSICSPCTADEEKMGRDTGFVFPSVKCECGFHDHILWDGWAAHQRLMFDIKCDPSKVYPSSAFLNKSDR